MLLGRHLLTWHCLYWMLRHRRLRILSRLRRNCLNRWSLRVLRLRYVLRRRRYILLLRMSHDLACTNYRLLSGRNWHLSLSYNWGRLTGRNLLRLADNLLVLRNLNGLGYSGRCLLSGWLQRLLWNGRHGCRRDKLGRLLLLSSGSLRRRNVTGWRLRGARLFCYRNLKNVSP